jgi:GNAT superfamily N-acetyltransferase
VVGRLTQAHHGGVDTLTVRCVDPATVPRPELEALLDALHQARAASAAVDQPYEPVETPALWRASVVAPWGGDPVRLVVASGSGGGVLGHALVELPSHDNLHLGLAELHVPFEHRRRGVGRALLDASVVLLAEAARRTLIAEARLGSPMESFMAASGAQRKLVDVRRNQPIGALDLDAVGSLRRDAERVAAGYRLESWVGGTPARRRDHLAEAIGSLNDAPMEDLDYDDEAWDAARVVQRDRFVAVGGLRLHVVLALAADDTPAGYTEVAVSADGSYGWQWGTGVVPAHRGHRLGLLLKASMVERLRATEPALRVVSTWNAAVNDHMIEINEALAYEPVDRMAEWQLDL